MIYKKVLLAVRSTTAALRDGVDVYHLNAGNNYNLPFVPISCLLQNIVTGDPLTIPLDGNQYNPFNKPEYKSIHNAALLSEFPDEIGVDTIPPVINGYTVNAYIPVASISEEQLSFAVGNSAFFLVGYSPRIDASYYAGTYGINRVDESAEPPDFTTPYGFQLPVKNNAYTNRILHPVKGADSGIYLPYLFNQ